MSDPTVQLQHLGFSEYEARAYTALLGRNPLNGYEIAKASGLPRANVYAVLRKLEERGAVFRLDTPDGTRYAPVSPDELLKRLRHHFLGVLNSAQRALNNASSPMEYEPVWNARGYAVLLEHARALLDATTHQLLVALSPEEATALADALARADGRGVQVTTLCLAGCPQECGGCRGRIYRHAGVQAQPNRWLVLVPDHREVLAGEIGPGDQALAVRTRQRLQVELATWYIRHSVALAAIVADLDKRLKDVLQPKTLAVLASVEPGDSRGGWLEHMARLLSDSGEGTDDE